MSDEAKNIERRAVIIFVPENFILQCLRGYPINLQFIRVPKCNIPDTARVMGVHHDYQRNAWAMVVEDASFEAVAEGMMLPELAVEWNMVELEIKNQNSENVQMWSAERPNATGRYKTQRISGFQEEVTVCDDPFNHNSSRLHVVGKRGGFWPLDSDRFNGWLWSAKIEDPAK